MNQDPDEENVLLELADIPRRKTNDFAQAVPVTDTRGADDRRLAARRAPMIRREWQNQYLRIIIVGESGTGKSTFINNLFYAYKREALLSHNRGINESTPASLFSQKPEQLCTSFVVENETERIRIHYSVSPTTTPK